MTILKEISSKTIRLSYTISKLGWKKNNESGWDGVWLTDCWVPWVTNKERLIKFSFTRRNVAHMFDLSLFLCGVRSKNDTHNYLRNNRISTRKEAPISWKYSLKKRHDSFKYNQSSGTFLLEVLFVLFRWEDLYFPWMVIQINNGPMDQPIPDTSKENRNILTDKDLDIIEILDTCYYH